MKLGDGRDECAPGHAQWIFLEQLNHLEPEVLEALQEDVLPLVPGFADMFEARSIIEDLIGAIRAGCRITGFAGSAQLCDLYTAHLAVAEALVSWAEDYNLNTWPILETAIGTILHWRANHDSIAAAWSHPDLLFGKLPRSRKRAHEKRSRCGAGVTRHFEWVVLQHVQRWPQRRIAALYQVDVRAVARAVRKLAAQLGLEIKPCEPGRPAKYAARLNEVVAHSE